MRPRVWGMEKLEMRTWEKGDRVTWWEARVGEFLNTKSLMFMFQLSDVWGCNVGFFALSLNFQ